MSPSFGHGCSGCYGCHGCHGCHGCSGCSGNAFSCSGCCGGCYGCSGCSGCYGGWGCYGTCFGCSGCNGYYSSCYGCCGGCYGSSYSSCYGCGGGYGCYGSYGCYGCGGVAVVPVHAEPTKPSMMRMKEATGLPSQGTVVVQLPADAKLYVDGQLAPLTSASRSFVTPDLQTGRDYYYTLKAEATRDGRTVAQSKKVVVRAGAVANVEFGDLRSTTVAEDAAPARITVKLPADAKLYVDGVACPLTSETRSFETPKLESGRAYTYTLKAELVRNGQTRSESRQVELRAGKPVTVEFGDLTPVATAQR